MARSLALASVPLVLIIALCSFTALAIDEWPFDSASRSLNIVDGEFRVPLYDLTYNEGKTFKSGYTGKRYRVPDSMDVIDNSDTLFNTYKSNLGNLTQTKNQHEKSSGWSFGLPFLGISKNKRSNTVKELLKDGKSELFMVQKDLGVFDVATWPNPKLSSRFLSRLGTLPVTYNAKTYKDFLDYAGTHYFTQGEFGGQLIFYVKVQEGIYKYMKKSEVFAMVGAYVSLLCVKMGFASGADRSYLTVSETFKSYAKAVCEITPGDGPVGDCEKMAGGTYRKWVNTVLGQPTLLTPRIEPLSNLIPSDFKNLAAIRANIAKAITSYSSSPVSASFQSAKRSAEEEFNLFASEDSMKRSICTTQPTTYLGMGYDAVTDEYRVLPIVNFNFTKINSNACDYQGCFSNEMQCWRDPLHRNVSYTLPKGTCVSLVGTSETQLGATAYMSRDALESYYHKKKTSKSFLGIKKKTKVTHEYSKRFYEEDMALSIAQLWNEKYKLSLSAIFGIPSPDLPLHPRFVAAAKALPANYSARSYRDFVLRFGTHYIYDSTFGGSLTSQDWFHRCLSYTYTDNYSSSSSSFSLLIVSKKSGSFSSSAKLDAKWMEYSTSLIQFTGGSPFAFNPTQYDNWLQSISANPAPITQTVEPLSEVVSTFDKVRGRNLLQAIKEYNSEMAVKEAGAQKFLKTLDPQDKPSWCKGYPKV